MSTLKLVRFVDDLDPEIDQDVQTMTFALDGKEYEIDLGEVNREKLLDALAEFIAAARKIGKPEKRNTTRLTRSTTPKDPTEAQQARAWAKENGVEVSERGRVSSEVITLWRESLKGAPEETSSDEDVPVARAGEENAMWDKIIESATQEPTDEEVMAWWQSKGYKPQTKVNGLMRSQYRAAHSRAAHAS